ncbi:hypothetical protein GWO43_12840 [candidate division KSB1 bacterium]|nr:hypothetical protein [candidate division KSB1 bacterium]NIR71316.1 hypothetical protein [candidate division KSB1 bacterium]NIS24826.1 hypothetical protein [candidate division KSB1 bacterium]NIT71746.1 hypothetical protein [candidate division KSB1 bacterium]NIU25461.1 hypothetical protein [candidate division KSB1 bacterium]
MIKRLSFRCFLFAIITVGCVSLRCELDSGLEFQDSGESIRHGIKGHIEFRGAWPENISEARLVASASFPPDPSEPLATFIFSDPIRIGTKSLDYGLSLQPDTYEIVAVIFRESNQPWDISNILAVHAPLDPCTIIPDLNEAVVVENDTSIVENVNLSVDLTKGSLSGNVEFVGEWSPDIQFVGVIVIENPINFFNFIPCGIAVLPLNVGEANYQVFVPAGDYVLLVVAGSSLSAIADVSDISIIGNYFEPGNNSRLGVIHVENNQNTPNIDVVADLDKFQAN